MEKQPKLRQSFNLRLIGKKWRVILRLNFGIHTKQTEVDVKSNSQLEIDKYHSKYISTKITLKDPSDWDKTNQCTFSDPVINHRLEVIKKAVQDVYDVYSTLYTGNSRMKAEYLRETIKKMVFGYKVKQRTVIVKGNSVIDKERINFDSKSVSRHYEEFERLSGESDVILKKVDEKLGAENVRKKLMGTLFSDYIKIYIERRKQDGSTPQTVKTYTNILSFVKAYDKETFKKSYVRDINESWVTQFMGWCRKRKMENGELYSYNYINANIQKSLKAVINHLKAFDKIDCGIEWSKKEIRKRTERTQEIALTYSQLKDIINVDLSNNKHLELSRNLMLIGCLTSLRVSDLKNLNIKKTLSGNYELDMITKKTKTQIRFVVHPLVGEIYEKYNGKIPKLSDQKLNKNVKKICHLAFQQGYKEFGTEITFTRRNPANPSQITTINKQLWECIKTSSFRRTWVTYAVSSNLMPLEMICKVTGHTKVSQLLEYAKISDMELNKKLTELYSKMEF